MLDFYRDYGVYTDPGEYASLLRDLPTSLPELCALVKAQLIHPFALPQYADLVPPDKACEDRDYPTVRSLLAGLVAANPAGLIADREPAERLILSCRSHALLLAAILKSRHIPVRVRYGFATYIVPGLHAYHVICEVWKDDRNRWVLVDPDRQVVDVPAEQFESAATAWMRYRQGGCNTSRYGVKGSWGAHPILGALVHDAAAVLGTEHLYWDEPPVAAISEEAMATIPKDRLAVLDQMAAALRDPDKTLRQVRALFDAHAFLQFPPVHAGTFRSKGA